MAVMAALFNSAIPRGKTIVFDLDNTIADEFGAKLRPGIKGLLSVLKKDYRLLLWTNSARLRARSILDEHHLSVYFEKMIFREDYDPVNKGLLKDLRTIEASFLVDDDPEEIEFNQKKGVGAYLISPFRSSFDTSLPDDDPQVQKMKSELREIYRLITKG